MEAEQKLLNIVSSERLIAWTGRGELVGGGGGGGVSQTEIKPAQSATHQVLLLKGHGWARPGSARLGVQLWINNLNVTVCRLNFWIVSVSGS